MHLTLRDFTVRYGAVVAVNKLALTVGAGEIVSVIGPNGAGKTSLIEGVIGLHPSSGSLKLDDNELSTSSTYQRARAGLSFVPGGRGVFGALSVRDNVAVACQSSFADTWARLVSWFPVLAAKADALASSLSGGQRQIVSIARAVASQPKFILMDEPSIGLSPLAVGQLRDVMTILTKNGIGILLSEQNAGLAMSVSSMCHLLVRGEMRLSGPPASLRHSREVEALYLGRSI